MTFALHKSRDNSYSVMVLLCQFAFGRFLQPMIKSSHAGVVCGIEKTLQKS